MCGSDNFFVVNGLDLSGSLPPMEDGGKTLPLEKDTDLAEENF